MHTPLAELLALIAVTLDGFVKIISFFYLKTKSSFFVLMGSGRLHMLSFSLNFVSFSLMPHGSSVKQLMSHSLDCRGDKTL